MRGLLVGMATLALAGCDRGGELSGPGPKASGRYAGIGTFEAGRLWREMAGVAAPTDAAAARLDDDEQIIVVIDSHSGEVRQCGNHSGVCVTMDPWARQGAAGKAPVKLNKHGADVAAEEEAAVSNAAVPAG